MGKLDVYEWNKNLFFMENTHMEKKGLGKLFNPNTTPKQTKIQHILSSTELQNEEQEDEYETLDISIIGVNKVLSGSTSLPRYSVTLMTSLCII